MNPRAEAGFSLLAPAKVNFTLEVLAKRNDGYHDVRMLMAGVSLFDELKFEPAAKLGLECDLAELAVDDSNLILKAARLLQSLNPSLPGARISLKKRIPLGAGLAGGSTDAAAALSGLNQFWGLGLPMEKLLELAAQLGSDVPFCLKSGWALAEGRGEKLSTLSSPPAFHLVLLNPGFQVSTPWAYQNVKLRQGQTQDLSRQVFEALSAKDLGQVEKLALNDLEAVTASKHSEIGQLQNLLKEEGALLTRMSGSGPTVWGLFKDEAAAMAAEKILKNKSFFCKTVHTLSNIPSPS